jgi:hypothetical protein
MTEAADRVKEKRGAELIARTPASYVYGDRSRGAWRLTREAWLARRQRLSNDSNQGGG